MFYNFTVVSSHHKSDVSPAAAAAQVQTSVKRVRSGFLGSLRCEMFPQRSLRPRRAPRLTAFKYSLFNPNPLNSVSTSLVGLLKVCRNIRVGRVI